MAVPLRRPSQPLANQQVRLSQIGYIPWEALANGIRILGAAGSGKTQLAVWLLFTSLLRGWPYIVLDPTGSLLNGLLARIQHYCAVNRLSDAEQAQLYRRLRYCDLSGQSGYITPFPLLQRLPGEQLSVVGDRVMSWILAMMPESKDAPVEGYTSIDKIMRPAAMILAALGLGVTELSDLLYNATKDYWRQRFDYLKATQGPEVGEAVQFFTVEYKSWDANLRQRRINLIEVVLQMFRYQAPLRAMFGAEGPGLDYGQIIRKGQIVLLDSSRLTGAYKSLVLNWILLHSFTPYIWWRGSGHYPPCGLMIDEISTLYMDTPKAMELFSQGFGELVHVLRRQFRIHPLTVIHQSVAQLHPQMASHLAALGNQVIGKPADYDSALLLAQQLFDYAPLLKRADPIYMNVPERGPRIIDYRPVEYTRDEVLHLQARTLLRLDTFKFLARLTRREGGGQGPLQQLDVKPLLGPFPDMAQVTVLRQQLAAVSGLPIDQVLREIQERKERRVEDIQQRKAHEMQSTSQSAIVPEGPEPTYDNEGYRIPE